MDDLKSHEFFRSSSASASSAIVGPSLLNPLGSTHSTALSNVTSPTSSGFPSATGGGAGAVGVAAVSQMLDQSVDELFVPYMEGARYLDKEGKSLTELYAAKLIRFTNWHVRNASTSPPDMQADCSSLQRAMNKAKPSNTIFDRMVNQLSSAAHQAAHPGSSSAVPSTTQPADHADASRLDRLMKFSGLSNIVDKGSSSADKPEEISPEMMYEDGDGELSVETAEKMLEWHAEAVGRMVELSPASEVCVHSAMSASFNVLFIDAPRMLRRAARRTPSRCSRCSQTASARAISRPLSTRSSLPALLCRSTRLAYPSPPTAPSISSRCTTARASPTSHRSESFGGPT